MLFAAVVPLWFTHDHAAPTVIDSTSDEKYDFSARVDALRCHSTDWLKARLLEARVEKDRWWLEELAVIRVLDDREALGPFPDASQSARTNKTNQRVARELESLPKLAAAAHNGEISKDRLEPLVELATPETDGEWSQRGKRMSPGDLDRMARMRQKVSAADAAARREARSVYTWRNSEKGVAWRGVPSRAPGASSPMRRAPMRRRRLQARA